MPCWSTSIPILGVSGTQTLFNVVAPESTTYTLSFGAAGAAISLTCKVYVNNVLVANDTVLVPTASAPAYLTFKANQGDTIVVKVSFVGVIAGELLARLGYIAETEFCTSGPFVNIPILSAVGNSVCINLGNNPYINVYSGFPAASIPPCTDPFLTLLKTIPVTVQGQGTQATVTIQAQGALSSQSLQSLASALEQGGQSYNFQVSNVQVSGNTLTFTVTETSTTQQIQLAIAIALAIAIIVIAVLIGLAIFQVIVSFKSGVATAVSTPLSLALTILVSAVGIGVIAYLYERGK
ncbi:MAG: hypothetical protein QXF40_02120 [Metallosphaera sp.]